MLVIILSLFIHSATPASDRGPATHRMGLPTPHPSTDPEVCFHVDSKSKELPNDIILTSLQIVSKYCGVLPYCIGD